MNSNELDKKIRFRIHAQAVSIISVVFIAGSLSCRGADPTDLPPTRSFVLDRLGGDSVFSGDLQWLAVGRQDGTVAVWNVAKGERAANWSGGSNLAFLPRSTELLVASGTNITVRELLTGRIVRRLESPTNTIRSLTFSPAGTVAAGTIDTSTTTGMVTVYRSEFIFWNLANGQIDRQMPTSRYPWESVFSSGGRLGAGGWTPRMLPISMGVGFCQAFSPEDGRFAVGLYRMPGVSLWNLAGSNYSHYLGTLLASPGDFSAGHVEKLAFLDRQRLAVVYGRQQLCVLTLNPTDADLLQGLPRVSFRAKKPTGELVTAEVVADAVDRAATQIRQFGLTPIAVESISDGPKTFQYSATNAAGQPASGYLQATNKAAATVQIENLGLKPTFVVEADWMGAQPGRTLNEKAQDATLSPIRRRQVLIGGPDLEIRSLAVSGDDRRLAVAGMRMGKRPGTFGGAMYGAFVYDAPMYGEVQVWDAVAMKLLATIKGRPDEKFSLVALDETGGRIAAVTYGVEYNSGMFSAMQQAAELRPALARRVYVWEMRAEKLAANPGK
jgi:hypothetical protein